MNGDQHAPSTSSIASAKSFASLAALGANSFAGASFPSTTTTAKNAMAAPAYFPVPQPRRTSLTPQTPYAPTLTAAVNREATTNPTGSSYPITVPGACNVLIRRLPLNTSEESLRLMMVFSKDLLDVQVMPVEQSPDAGFRSAMLTFKTIAGAHEAQTMLDGKSNISNDADMVVDIIGTASPTPGTHYTLDSMLPSPVPMPLSTESSSTSSRQSSRFNGGFQALENMMASPLNNPSMNGSMYGVSDLAGQEQSAHFHNIFSPQSPIGNHLTDRSRVSGKTLINEGADDEETGELLKDPVAYAENGPMSINPRRSAGPAVHNTSRMAAALSLNTSAAATPAMPAYGRSGMTPLSAHSSALSPTIMGGSGPPILNYNQMYRTHNFPPANPADQNPPCNTLYVGNLPIDTSEEELKAMFSKQRGYKRLCFRTKQNGPMCFVEFEDVSAATKALHELYGHPLHNSIKGGIRLSFSKNPLGVRSNQNPGLLAAAAMAGMSPMLTGSGGGFTTANGPPPGLTAPPGLSMSRPAAYQSTNGNGSAVGSGNSSPYSSTGFSVPPPSNGWNMNYSTMAAGRPAAMLAAASSGVPPHMMGR